MGSQQNCWLVGGVRQRGTVVVAWWELCSWGQSDSIHFGI